MHTEIRTPSEKNIRLSEQYLKMAEETRLMRLALQRHERFLRRKALSLLEIPVLKLP